MTHQTNKLDDLIWRYMYGHELDKDELVNMLISDRQDNDQVEDLEDEVIELQGEIYTLEIRVDELETENEWLEDTLKEETEYSNNILLDGF